MQELFVNMGEMAALKSSGVLTTVGLGSCIGLTIYDPVAQVGGMAHIFLARNPNSEKAPELPGKYADTGVKALIDLVESLGTRQRRLEAKLAGGANIFNNLSANGLSIGQQNIIAVREQLEKYQIPIVGEQVAGNKGRKMRLSIETGIVIVTSVGQQPVEI